MSNSRSFVRRGLIFVAALLMSVAAAASGQREFCPPVYEAGVIGPLNFTPAFTTIQKFNTPNGGKRDGLLMSSFFNSIKDPTGENVIGFFEDDLVARIENIAHVDPDTFDPNTDVERLTDLGPGPALTVWPNGVDRAPDGFVAFEAVVVPGGFHPTPPPGRLSIINLDDAGRQEYIVDQSTQLPFPPFTCPFPVAEENAPRFYHQVRYVDMDQDGWLDLVTVRASFKVSGGFCLLALGEVVWFRNPGAAIDPNTEWEENVLLGGLPPNLFEAEINMDVHDFEGDGVPEIIGTHFFNGDQITLYGAPLGQKWSDVDPIANPPRKKDINDDQGKPFEVEVIDLNRDGRDDILASNHQGDDCFDVTADPIPGRVYALEQPDSGDIFNDDWTVRILKDNIRPNPTFPEPSMGPGRLAPGRAKAFWPKRAHEGKKKPWIVVGGDEASKVWLLKPKNESRNNWEYKSAVLFDINDFYGPNASQSFTAPPPSQGNSISTIGGQSVRYDAPGPNGRAEIYVPVFEGRDIHKFSFRPQGPGTKVDCVDDVQIACPVP
ncbi:MAG: hypothetical protein ACR2QV_03155 [Gammaproteobacteria bacterium]